MECQQIQNQVGLKYSDTTHLHSDWYIHFGIKGVRHILFLQSESLKHLGLIPVKRKYNKIS